VATWIVHLRLAEKLLELIPDLDAEAFAVGNVAPDSGIPDENWENFNPPPQISHYQDPEQERWAIADLDFYRNYLSAGSETRKDLKKYSFLFGYFLHLVTDNLWADRIARPTMEKFKEELEADPKFIWQVKRDWYGLDFEHVRQNSDSIYWHTFLSAEYNESYLAFMPREAIQQRIQHIKELYQRTDEEIEEWYGNRPDLYLSKDEMDDFIQFATRITNDIYESLFVDSKEIADLRSAIELDSIDWPD
jgi:hypothetical protein